MKNENNCKCTDIRRSSFLDVKSKKRPNNDNKIY